MLIPTFNTTRSIASLGSVTEDQLGWILRNDHILTQRTQAVRAATDPSRLKLKLPGVSLGGVFKPLPPNADHGPRCGGRCWPAGYRNSQHIDWQAKAGLVLIDIDDLQPPATPDAVKFLLRHSAPAIALAWVSARGRGLKLGVLTHPIPTAGQNVDAWSAAYAVCRGRPIFRSPPLRHQIGSDRLKLSVCVPIVCTYDPMTPHVLMDRASVMRTPSPPPQCSNTSHTVSFVRHPYLMY